MKRSSFIKVLLTPSIFSALLTLFLAALILGAACWTYIDNYQLFYDYFFGRFGITTILLSLDVSGANILNVSVFSNPILYYVVIVVGAVMVGMITYAFLQSIGKIAMSAHIAWDELHSKSQAYFLFTRLSLRIISLAIWAVYTLFFTGMLVPSSVLIAENGIDLIAVAQPFGWLYFIPAFFLLLISLHMHVIFARLCFLRLRLFGGWDQELQNYSQ